MTIWLWIACFSGALYWSIFLYLLSRRGWTAAALAVGVLHLLFAMPLMVAPIRSSLDPAYPGYQIDFLRFEGRAAILPSAIILSWALSSAWFSVAKGSGRWMRVVAIGDLFFASLLGVGFVRDLLKGELSGPQIQLGEHLTLSGPVWALVLVMLFALPFIASAIWAMKRSRFNGGDPPLAVQTDELHANSKESSQSSDGFRYSAA